MLASLVLVGCKYKTEYPIAFIGAIWFLEVLFLAKIITQYFINRMKKCWIVIILSACSLLFTHVTRFVLPFGILQALSASSFLLIGYWLKRVNVFDKVSSKTLKYAIFVLTAATILVMNKSSVAMRVNAMPWNLLSYVSSTWISVIIVFWCSIWERRKNTTFSHLYILLAFCGKYSLVFLCVHDIETFAHWSAWLPQKCTVVFFVRLAYILILTYLLTKIKLSKMIFNIS